MFDFLPREKQEWVRDQGFSPLVELPGGYCSRVFADESRVLKVPFQGEELATGLEAALFLADFGGPRVHAYSRELGLILMERIQPGTPLSGEEGECREVLRHLIAGFRTVSKDGMMPLDQFYGPHPLIEELVATAEIEVILHGDLHHFNILRGQSGWVAIDPKGLRGDPAYECVAFIRNPVDQLDETADLTGLIEDRIRYFAKFLRVSPWRIWAWLLVDLQLGEASREPGHVWGRLQHVVEGLETRILADR